MLQEIALATSLANYVIGVCGSGLLAIAVIMRFRHAGIVAGDERAFLYGILTSGTGLFLHQSYWLAWRVTVNLDMHEAAFWFASHAWMVTPFYALLVFGALKCMAVVSGFHNHIPKSHICAAIAIWFFGLLVGLYLQ